MPAYLCVKVARASRTWLYIFTRGKNLLNFLTVLGVLFSLFSFNGSSIAHAQAASTFLPVADARVLETSPTTNYGTLNRLDVDNPGQESYIRFTVSGVTGTVQSATLRLFVTNGSANGPSIYGTVDTWTESGITWNNRSAPTTGVIANLGTATASTWAEYNVTAYVTGNGTYSFVLLPDSTDGVTFHSREGTSPPQLVLTFASGPTSTPTITSTPTNTPTPTSAPTTGPSSTPTNTATATSTPLNTPTPTNTPVSTGITLAAVADARVLQSSPTTNYGTLNRLDVDNPGQESYIRFTVSGVTGAVQSATLRLFVTNGSSNGPSLYTTDNSWTETGITWNNRPAPTSGVISDIGSIGANAWAQYNVTAVVTGNGTYSFALLPDSMNGVTFHSREGTSPPQLVLTFASGPTSTPTITSTPTNTPTSTSTPTNTLTPTNTPTPTATGTPTGTPTIGPSPTPTDTPLPTDTATSTPTATNTGTSTATFTPTNTPTPTDAPMATATFTPTATPTNTSVSSVISLAAVADARVLAISPDTNYGTLAQLDIDNPGEESYIRFTVSGITGPIQSATLRLFVTNGSANGPSIYGTDDTWTESGITWNNRPAPTTGAIANLGTATAGTWVTYNLTAYITGNGTYSFVFLPDSTDGIRFDSREGTSPPQLVLTYASGPIDTPTPGPSPTPTSTGTPTNTPSSESVVFVGAGDIADCSGAQDEETAQLLDNIPGTVYTVGDNAYPNGTISEYNNCYHPTWGRHKARTYPVLGDNEYNSSSTASGYFTYFGAAAGDPTKGYYSYDLGNWHIIVLNSNCSNVGGCDPNSAQGQWLQTDLAANPRACTLAIFHEPLFSSSGGDTGLRDFWVFLYNAGADIVLGGHRHNYERFALQNPDGVADPGRGIREFVVGTGGRSHSSFGSTAPNSEVRNNTAYGVLKLTLHPTSYDWEFIPIAGQTFTDSGSGLCVTP